MVIIPQFNINKFSFNILNHRLSTILTFRLHVCKICHICDKSNVMSFLRKLFSGALGICLPASAHKLNAPGFSHMHLYYNLTK